MAITTQVVCLQSNIMPEWAFEHQTLPDRLPQSLIEWLARINRRYLALNQEKTNWEQDVRKLLHDLCRNADLEACLNLAAKKINIM